MIFTAQIAERKQSKQLSFTCAYCFYIDGYILSVELTKNNQVNEEIKFCPECRCLNVIQSIICTNSIQLYQQVKTHDVKMTRKGLVI